MKKKNIISVLVILTIMIVSVGFAHDNPSKTPTPKMPDDVQVIIKKSCYGCHNSDSKNEKAKKDLDFKKMDDLTDMKKISAYKNIGEVVEKNDMPPKKFLQKNPEAKMTDDEKQTLITWAKKEAETLVKSK